MLIKFFDVSYSIDSVVVEIIQSRKDCPMPSLIPNLRPSMYIPNANILKPAHSKRADLSVFEDCTAAYIITLLHKTSPSPFLHYS